MIKDKTELDKMPKIAIKQNKKGTFLDLSKEDLRNKTFVNGFSDFAEEISSFLSGSAVSVILPDDIDIAQIGGDSRTVIDQVKTELNRRNISIKALTNSNKQTVETTKSDEAPRKATLKMQEEATKVSESKEVVDVSSLPETLYVEANLRSGQLIRYPGNVFILGDVNPSAEIIAAGDVIVWGTLRGIVHAGADGDTEAKIIAMRIESGQIRIAAKMLAINKATSKKSTLIIPEMVKIESGEIKISKYF
jgi:septum site-determining protein MinC